MEDGEIAPAAAGPSDVSPFVSKVLVSFCSHVENCFGLWTFGLWIYLRLICLANKIGNLSTQELI